jgi:hypothetical protein
LHPVNWFEHYGFSNGFRDDFSGVGVHQLIERSPVVADGDFEDGVDVVVRDDFDEALASGEGGPL